MLSMNFEISVEYSVIPKLFVKTGVLIVFENLSKPGFINGISNSLTLSARKLIIMRLSPSDIPL